MIDKVINVRATISTDELCNRLVAILTRKRHITEEVAQYRATKIVERYLPIIDQQRILTGAVLSHMVIMYHQNYPEG